MKVIVVEDNAGIREIVVDLCRRRGHAVAAFGEAESAWSWAEAHPFDLAILDWGLPGMDGLELCRRLRGAPDGERPVVILLTVRAGVDDLDEVVAAGVDDYVVKPFKLEALDVRVAFAERQVRQHELKFRAKADVLESERRQRELALAERRHADQLRLLDRIRSAVANELEPERIFRIVVETTAEILGYSHTSLYTIEGNHLRLRHQVGYDDPAKIYDVIALGQGITGTVAQTGAPMLLRDARSWPGFLAASDDVAHEICVPLHDDGRIVGVFNVESIAERPLDEDDLMLLQSVAELVSGTMTRSRLCNEARERESVLQRVLDSVQEVVFTADARGRWNFLNQAWERITGHGVAESLGRSGTEFILPERRAAFEAAVESLSSGRELELRGDMELVTAGGGRRWVEVHATRRADGVPPFEISGTLIDITERKRMEEQLLRSQDRFRHLAMHDPLTSLPNRSLFLERLDSALREHADDDACTFVLFLDLDGFKLVNDTFGHAIGDRLLVQVGQRLSRCVRPTDTIARLGGDEFAALLVSARSSTVAIEIAQRMINALRPPFTIDGEQISISASIGIAGHVGSGGQGAELLRNADTALYAAKADGRGISTSYAPEMSAAVLTRYRQEHELRRAIDNDELVIHYLPIFDLRSREIAGMEALTRWLHPERGILPPNEFIELAESTGLIVPLGLVTLLRIRADIRRWKTLTERPLPTIAINVSERQLHDDSLVSEIATLLKASEIDPPALELEIAEAALRGGIGATLPRLEMLRGLGVGLVLDDFGTGFASLASLHELPVNGVKIDRRFISGLSRGPTGTALVRAIAALAQSLDLTVTAEGIETVEQLSFVRSIEIARGQGYYFTRPLPSEEIEHLIAESAPHSAGLLLSN